jgi:hypothetical protein
MADESVILVCNPNLESKDAIPGTAFADCAECGQVVLLAPSGQRIQETTDAKLVCTSCAVKNHAGWEKVVAAPNDEQVAELETFWKRRLGAYGYLAALRRDAR